MAISDSRTNPLSDPDEERGLEDRDTFLLCVPGLGLGALAILSGFDLPLDGPNCFFLGVFFAPFDESSDESSNMKRAAISIDGLREIGGVPGECRGGMGDRESNLLSSCSCVAGSV